MRVGVGWGGVGWGGVGWGGVGWGGEMVLHLRFPCYKLQIKFTNLDHVIKYFSSGSQYSGLQYGFIV